jgi:hypothetical protein
MSEVVVDFDYDELPYGEADALKLAAERIKTNGRRIIEDIVEIGRDLIDAKRRIGHGKFLMWIEASFGMSDDTARNFMNVANVYGDKVRIVRNLPLGAIYALSAPSTPESVRAEVAERAAHGESITASEISRLKKEAALAEELRGENAALRDDKAALADEVVELRDQVRQPIAITMVPDRTMLNQHYEAFVLHWRSLTMELRERFFEEHKTPYAARLPAEEKINAH